MGDAVEHDLGDRALAGVGLARGFVVDREASGSIARGRGLVALPARRSACAAGPPSSSVDAGWAAARALASGSAVVGRGLARWVAGAATASVGAGPQSPGAAMAGTAIAAASTASRRPTWRRACAATNGRARPRRVIRAEKSRGRKSGGGLSVIERLRRLAGPGAGRTRGVGRVPKLDSGRGSGKFAADVTDRPGDRAGGCELAEGTGCQSRAAPATVTGEPRSIMPLGQEPSRPGKAGRRRRSGSQETWPRLSFGRRARCTGRQRQGAAPALARAPSRAGRHVRSAREVPCTNICFRYPGAGVAGGGVRARGGRGGEIVTGDLPRETYITVVASGSDKVESTGPGSRSGIFGAEEIAAVKGPSIVRMLERAPRLTVSLQRRARQLHRGARARGGGRAAAGHSRPSADDGSEVAPSAGFDFRTLLSYGIGKIELLRGSNGTIWGSLAMGGVLAVATAERGCVEASAEYGANDTVAGSLVAGTEWSSGSASLAAALVDTDGFSATASGSEPDGFRQWQVGGRALTTMRATGSRSTPRAASLRGGSTSTASRPRLHIYRHTRISALHGRPRVVWAQGLTGGTCR